MGLGTSTTAGERRSGSAELAQTALSERLQRRRSEIEQATLNRIHAVADPGETSDPTYVERLREAAAAAVDYALAAVQQGEGCPPPPTVLFAQARLAARSGVSLETVLRRYFAGYTLLGDFLVEEAQRDGMLEGPPLKRLLRTQAALFDRLLVSVSEEYSREAESRSDTAEQRRAERVQQLLAGELLDLSALATELAYEFDAQHLGVIASGPGAAEAIRDVAVSLDCRSLLIDGAGGLWAWLGSRRGIDPARLDRLAVPDPSGCVAVAFGEPGEGLPGWRLTHRQAMAALPIALRGPKKQVRYADIALLASVLQDDLLAASLREIYLAPLEAERGGGEVARQTLRAYFRAGGNVSSAAAALGLNRNTVASRIAAIEACVGRPLGRCAPEFETALRLDELDTQAPLPAS